MSFMLENVALWGRKMAQVGQNEAELNVLLLIVWALRSHSVKSIKHLERAQLFYAPMN